MKIEQKAYDSLLDSLERVCIASIISVMKSAHPDLVVSEESARNVLSSVGLRIAFGTTFDDVAMEVFEDKNE